MKIICKTNDAFEDSLTDGKSYSLLELKNASVRIINDRGEARWYGANRFDLFPQLQPTPAPEAALSIQ